MANVQVRLSSVQLKPNGRYHVEATLPDGSFYVGEVAASLDRKEIALALAGVETNRSLNGMTGLVEMDQAEWDAAVEAAKTATATATPVDASAAAAKAEKVSK